MSVILWFSLFLTAFSYFILAGLEVHAHFEELSHGHENRNHKQERERESSKRGRS